MQGRPPLRPQAAWVHQIHAAGGTSGSTTMVMVFVMLFVLFVRFLTHDLSVVLVVRTFLRCHKVAHPGFTIPCGISGSFRSDTGNLFRMGCPRALTLGLK